MESKTISKPCKHNSELYINEEDLNKNTKDTQKHQNQKANYQLSSSKNKRSSDLSKKARKHASKKICLLNQENLIFNSRVYQDYIKIYHKFTSLYFIVDDYNQGIAEFIIYDTKTESVKKKVTDQRINSIIQDNCITQLPNGSLFCFGKEIWEENTNTFLIDRDYHVHELPSNLYISCNSSAIYYNRNVYCFGGLDWDSYGVDFSSRFDLDQNRWIELNPIPKQDCCCSTAIFNGNILITSTLNINLWLYSIDINSFSIIPYEFQDETKIMVNAEERLYLIENSDYLNIYESEIWDEFSWKLVIKFWHGDFSLKSAIYNKKKKSIYILSTDILDCYKPNYFKFDLKKKVLNKKKVRKCRIF